MLSFTLFDFPFFLVFLALCASTSTSAPTSVITRMRVHCDVQHRYAITRVRTRMRNVADGAKETTFKIALPELAFISNFSMTIDGVEYPGNIKVV